MTTKYLSAELRQAIAQQPEQPLYLVDDVRATYPLQQRVAKQVWSHPGDAAYDDYDSHRRQP